MIDTFLYWGNHVEAKSGKIKGSCQPPLACHIATELMFYFSTGLDKHEEVGTEDVNIIMHNQEESSNVTTTT